MSSHDAAKLAKGFANCINRGQTKKVEEMIDQGAPLEDYFEDIYGNLTPLARAARLGNADLVKLLLAAGADVNAPPSDPWEDNALRSTFQLGSAAHVEAARLLIEAGADVNHQSFSEDSVPVTTAIMDACTDADDAAIAALIDAGADVNACLRFGTALTNAIKANRPTVVKLLLDAGADPTVRYPADGGTPELRGKTPLGVAKKLKRKKIQGLLETLDVA